MRDKIYFIGKFFVISFFLFLVWIIIGRYYLLFLSYLSQFILSFMGYNVTIILNENIIFSYLGSELNLSHAELTNFNIVPFIALVLASPISWYRRERSFLIGIPIIILFHLLNLIAHFPYYYEENMIAGFIINFSSITRLIIPFLLWFALTYDSILPLFRMRKKEYICPICNQTKTGIVDHISANHKNIDAKQREIIHRFYKKHPELIHSSQKKQENTYYSKIKNIFKKI